MERVCRVRRLAEAEKERSACGWRQRLFTTGDDAGAFIHVVWISDAAAHYHRKATEFYYVLEGEGTAVLDGEKVRLDPGTCVEIPPGVVHSASGDILVLVIGIPEIRDDDTFMPDE